MNRQRYSAIDPGERFLTALAERAFPQLAATLSPDVRMRALVPPGLVAISGAEAAAARFSAWFGDAEQFELVSSGSDAPADRRHVFYRLRLRKPGNRPTVVEQHLLCALDGARVGAFDLVCSGFRPDDGLGPLPART